MRPLLVPALLALAGAAAAADIPVTASGGRAAAEEGALLRATPVTWPATTASLAEAAAWLALAGNQVDLGPGTDPTARRPLPAFSGSWWDGLDRIARAFDLELLPAVAEFEADERMQVLPNGHLMRGGEAVATGIPVLVPSRGRIRALASHAGPCRLEWRRPEIRDGDGGRRLHGDLVARLEPRLADQGRPGAMVLPRVGGGDNGGDGVVMDGDGLPALAVQLRIDAPWSATGSLAAGDRLIVNVGRRRITVERGEDTVTARYGDGDDGFLGTVQILADGEELDADRTSTHRDGRATTREVGVEGMPEGPVEIRLAGLVRGRSIAAEPAPVDAARLPDRPLAAASAAAVATRVAWAAGRRRLADAAALLQAGGNRVLLPFGAATGEERDLPAWDGPWWGGVLAVATAWGLRVVPPAQADGPVGLEPGRSGGGGGAGPFLVLVEGVERSTVRTGDGIDQRAVVRFRLVPEPRLGGAVGEARITWASAATHPGGSAAVVDDGPDGDDPFSGMHRGMILDRIRDRDGDGAGTVIPCRLERLPPGPVRLALDGLLSIGPGPAIDLSVSVAPGRPQVVEAGDLAWGLDLVPAEDLARFARQLDGQGGTFLRVRALGAAELPGMPRLTAADGSEIEFQRSIHADSGTYHLLPPLPPGPLTVRLSVPGEPGGGRIPVR
ncbi:MAG: hypothetical protein RLZZ127_2925, partial [Planctomycetota bacterium]